MEETAPTRRLIVNADDFGLHPSVNQAIILAHREGIVTSTTVLAGGTAFFDSLAELKRCPELGIGIHLCLVDQKPVLPPEKIPSLLDADGGFCASYSQFIKRYALGKVKLNEVKAEFTAQIEILLDAGIHPTHQDSHQHLHLLPGISRVVMELGRKYGIRGIRIPMERVFYSSDPTSPLRLIQSRFVSRLASRCRREYEKAGFKSPDYFAGFTRGGRFLLENWRSVIPSLPTGVTEVMVHPGTDSGVLDEFTGWGYHWNEELEALTHPEVRLMLIENGVELTHYGRLT